MTVKARVVTAAVNGKCVHDDVDADSYEWIETLHRRRRGIKGAITTSNATQTIQVGDRRMLVSEAIATQQEMLGYDGLCITALKAQLNEASAAVTKAEEQREVVLDGFIQSLCGRDSTRTRADDVEALTETFMRSHRVELIDPLGIAGKIKALEDQMQRFEEDVDVALSEHNATTYIEVPAMSPAQHQRLLQCARREANTTQNRSMHARMPAAMDGSAVSGGSSDNNLYAATCDDGAEWNATCDDETTPH